MAINCTLQLIIHQMGICAMYERKNRRLFKFVIYIASRLSYRYYSLYLLSPQFIFMRVQKYLLKFFFFPLYFLLLYNFFHHIQPYSMCCRRRHIQFPNFAMNAAGVQHAYNFMQAHRTKML